MLGPVITDDHETMLATASNLLRREVMLVRPLTGGQHATTLLVSDGATCYVVKRFPPGDDAAAHELVVQSRRRWLRPCREFTSTTASGCAERPPVRPLVRFRSSSERTGSSTTSTGASLF